MTVNNIRKHLEDRGYPTEKPGYFPVWLDENENVAYFPLYNLSGRLVGYQRYNPTGVKGKDSYKELDENKKYYTYVIRENTDRNVPYIAMFGLHTLKRHKNYIFVVEGIFDAVKIMKLGEPVIAVLANKPKPLRNFFFCLQKITIGILDAGETNNPVCDICFSVPNSYKDVGEMPQEKVNEFIEKILKSLK